jgi:hypothetical protein
MTKQEIITEKFQMLQHCHKIVQAVDDLVTFGH